MNVVVIDTNVFVRQTHLCRKKQGPALVGALRATGGMLFLPEILRTEYREQTQAAVNDHFSDLQKAESALKSLIGLDESQPPSPSAIRRLVDQRLDSLEPIVLEGPGIDDLSLATTRRTVDKRPPGTKSDHGFKDSMIWESILTLEPGTKVWLATNDHGFFNGKSNELHPTLREEAAARGIDVEIVRNLEPIVEAIARQYPDLDLAEVEHRELQDQGEAAVITVPPAPTSSNAIGTQGDAAAVQMALAAGEGRFEGLDLKVFGFISYLDPVSKSDLFEALSLGGLAADVAENVIGRLVLIGLVRDSGSHYLVADRSLQEAAAATVESEIIALLASKRVAHE